MLHLKRKPDPCYIYPLPFACSNFACCPFSLLAALLVECYNHKPLKWCFHILPHLKGPPLPHLRFYGSNSHLSHTAIFALYTSIKSRKFGLLQYSICVKNRGVSNVFLTYFWLFFGRSMQTWGLRGTRGGGLTPPPDKSSTGLLSNTIRQICCPDRSVVRSTQCEHIQMDLFSCPVSN